MTKKKKSHSSIPKVIVRIKKKYPKSHKKYPKSHSSAFLNTHKSYQINCLQRFFQPLITQITHVFK